MSEPLLPCPSCALHLRANETTCPFCHAALPATFGARPPPAARQRPVSRAAVLFAAASVAAGCGGNEASVVLYGPAPIEDSGAVDAPADARADGGTNATDAAEDTGGLPVLYGPAPVPLDAGQDD